MPHVIVKMWPGKPEHRKEALADAITKAVTEKLGYGEDAVSISIEEIAPDTWTDRVYKPDIINGTGKLYKKPGY